MKSDKNFSYIRNGHNIQRQTMKGIVTVSSIYYIFRERTDDKMQKLLSKKNSYWSKQFKKEIPFFIMLIPAFILVLIYSYGPMAGIAMAFQDFRLSDGIFGSSFNGLDNFRTLFAMPNFWPVIRNTLIIALGKMIGGIVVPVGFALLLNEIRHMGFKKSIQTMVFTELLIMGDSCKYFY